MWDRQPYGSLSAGLKVGNLGGGRVEKCPDPQARGSAHTTMGGKETSTAGGLQKAGSNGDQPSRKSSVRRASSAALKFAASAAGARRRRSTTTIAATPINRAAGGSPHKAAVCQANCGRSSTNSP